VGPDAAAVVQYAPERSVTLRLGPESLPRAFVKVYAPGSVDTTRLAARYNLVADWLGRSGLSAPAAHVEGPESLVLQAMPGASWLTAPRSRLVAAMRELGQAIGQLHLAPVDDPDAIGLAWFGRLEPTRLARSGDLVARAVPSVASLATSLADRLVATHRSDRAPVLLHGDCHPGNVLVTSDAVSLVDLDQSALGAPAADLGSLLARLRYGALVGEPHADLAETLTAAFLDGYAAERPLPDDSDLRWSTAAALLAERALRTVNRVRPSGLEVLEDVLHAAHSILDAGAAR
jgi:Ser/Thr protein kinase RdoA (MazF antagonist)